MQLSDVTIQPVLFTVLFVYIFGGGIPIPGGGSYKDFVLAGLLALNLVTSTMGTAVGLSTDLHEGMIDRFRTLPMWRAAVLVGRSIADLMTSVSVCADRGLTGSGRRVAPDASSSPSSGRLRPGAVLRLLALVGRGLRGAEQQEPRIGRLLRLHRAVPTGFRLQRHGAHPAHARLDAGDRGLEPGQRGDRRTRATVGEPEPVGHDPRLADAAPSGGRLDLVGADPGRRRPAASYFFKRRTTE